MLQKKSLKDEVFELLHKRVVAGEYSPGDWLRQEEISSQLGVSQTPVREALDGLVSAGLVERVPYRGVRVPEPSQTEILDAYATRLVLENIITHLTAQNLSEDQAVVLRSLVKKMEHLVSLEDMSTLRQMNRKFHLAIAQACGNELLYRFYEMTANLFPDWMLYEYMFRHPELLSISLEKELHDHQAIADALARHDADLAAAHALRHTRRLGQELAEFLGIPADHVADRERQVEPLLVTRNQTKA